MIKYVIYIIVTYTVLTVMEWVMHRYILHTIDPLHMKHHDITHHNMKDDNDIGIFFSIFSFRVLVPGVLPALLQMYLFSNFIYPQADIRIFAIIHIVFFFCGILLLNSFHAYVHGWDCPESEFGEPCLSNKTFKKLLKWLPCLKFLIENHRTHHETKTSNFSVVFPGADFIFGTYVPPRKKK